MTELTTAQLNQIQKYLDFIRQNGGHGSIEIVVRNGNIKFINLGSVSKKVEVDAKNML